MLVAISRRAKKFWGFDVIKIIEKIRDDVCSIYSSEPFNIGKYVTAKRVIKIIEENNLSRADVVRLMDEMRTIPILDDYDRGRHSMAGMISYAMKRF
jgi:nucleoside-triphosphatase THEP1